MKKLLALLIFCANLQAASPWQACKNLWLRLSRNPEYEIQQAKAILPNFIQKNQVIWTEKFRQSGAEKIRQSGGLAIGEEGEEAWIRKLQGAVVKSRDLRLNSQNRDLHNQTWSTDMMGEALVIKKPVRRVDIASGRVQSFTGNPEFEVLAYALSSALGAHVVPPAVKLAAPYVGIQKIKAGMPYSLRQAAADHRLYMDLSHGSMIDHLLNNPDRKNEGILVVAKNVYFYDFDLSQSETRYSGFVGWLDFPFESVLVDRTKIALPWVIARPVWEALRGLNRDRLMALYTRHRLTLNESTIDTILGQRDQLVGSIQRWEESLGIQLVLE